MDNDIAIIEFSFQAFPVCNIAYGCFKTGLLADRCPFFCPDQTPGSIFPFAKGINQMATDKTCPASNKKPHSEFIRGTFVPL
jgi:hypothetical protein